MNRELFKISIQQSVLDTIYLKLANSNISLTHAKFGWQRGTDANYLNELVSYWKNSFDWRKQENELNRFDHYTAKIQGKQIHFIYQKGKGTNSKPLLLTHGWPDSFYRFNKVIDWLTNPGNGEQSFDVIIPSLPGFGFTDSFPLELTADIWVDLMTKELGYNTFYAAGGDIGGTITIQLAEKYPEYVKAVHLTDVGLPVGDEAILQTSAAVREFAAAIPQGLMQVGAFLLLQASKPQTIAYALNDSPVGYAAWVIEKFNDWTANNGAREEVFSKDELLTHIMLYLVSDTVQSSLHTYYDWTKLAPAKKVQVPSAFAQFPKEPILPPREWVESRINLQRYTIMARGGHFGAWECPELYYTDLKEFFSEF